MGMDHETRLAMAKIGYILLTEDVVTNTFGQNDFHVKESPFARLVIMSCKVVLLKRRV